MPDDKEIRIRATLDASQFDRGIQEIQRKLRTMTNTQSGLQDASSMFGDKGLMGKYASQAFGDFSKDAQANLQKMSQMQRQEAVMQRINMREKEQQIKNLVESDTKLTRQQEIRLKMHKEELEILKKKHQQTIIQNAETERALTRIQGEAGGGGGGAGGPGGPAGAGGTGGFRALLRQLATASVFGGAANAMIAGTEHLVARDRVITQAQGAAYTSAARPLAEQFEGRGARGMFFAGERSEAANMAAKEAGRQDVLQAVKTIGAVAAATAAGAVVAGPVGAAIGGAGAFGGMMTNNKARSQIFDREQFRALVSREGMQNYEQNLQAIIARNPQKYLAGKYFEQNYNQIAGLQQTLGMNTDAELLGGGGSAGWLENQINVGNQLGGARLNQRIVQQQAQQIIQAGGTTAAARGLAGTAGAMNRQLNVGNVGALMGQISGAGVGEKQTEQYVRRLFAEAVKMGVDASKMPQEMQRMTQMTAALATAGGGFAGGAMEVGLAGIGGFDRTSIAAASTAAGIFKQTGKAAGGWEGQMGLAFLQSPQATRLAGGKKLSGTAMNMINQMSYAEARPEDISRLASYLGTDEKSARELLKQKDVFKQSRTSLEQSAYQDLGQFLQQSGAQTPDEIKKLIDTGEGASLFMRAREAATSVKGNRFSNMTPAQIDARILQQARMSAPEAEGGTGNFGEIMLQAELSRTEGRGARLQQGAEGTGDIARLRNLANNIDALGEAAKKHTEHAEAYNQAFEMFKTAVEKGEKAMDAWAASLEDLAIKTENYGPTE